MSKFFRYLKVQLKRALRHYPIILIFTIVLTISILLFVNAMFRSRENGENKMRFEIGLVGDLSETYLDIGIVAIKNLDSSQYYVEFTEMDEEVAKEKLLAAEIYGYVLIPDGFVTSVVNGENKPLTYVAADNPASFGPILTNEIVQIVSKLIIQAQNGIYGLSEIADIYGVKGTKYHDAIEELNIEYISAVLDREGFYEHTYLGLGDGLSFQDYYTCSFMILLLLLWGIACAALLIRHDVTLPRILKSNGYRLGTMVMGDYLPFLAMMSLNAFALLVAGGVYLGLDGIELFVGVFPAIVMITAMQFLLYEMSTNMISGVLMQLFVAVLLSYSSGLFYPIYSLPEIVQKVSNVLPTGIAFDYLGEIVSGRTGWEIRPKVWMYSVIFIALSMLIRQYKIRSNKYD